MMAEAGIARFGQALGGVYGFKHVVLGGNVRISCDNEEK
jgi:hypothetical protein